MPAYLKIEGVDGESSYALFRGAVPIADLASVSGTDFITCTTGDPLTVCDKLVFQTPQSPTGIELENLLVSSFVNLSTGAMGSRTYAFAPRSFDTLGTFTSIDGTAIVTLSAVPESGVWLMLIAGFGLVGTALRRRRAPIIAAL